jgi:hypothetical protein
MADQFSNINNLADPGRKMYAIAPADGADLTNVPKALYITGAGNISIDPVDGPGTALVVGVPANYVFDLVRVKRVRATGTTATGIFGIE